MLKKISLIMLTILLVLPMIVGCQKNIDASAGPENTALAQNEFADYYFYYPNDWTLDSNNTFISIISGDSIIAPANKSISVMVSDLFDAKMTLQEFWEHSKKLVSGTFTDYTEVLKDEEVKVGDINALSVIYTAKITDKVYKFKQTFVVRSGSVYIITYTATEADFDKGTNAYNTVIETFKFK